MELSNAHKAMVQRYIAYCKGKRERLFVDREAEKLEFMTDRLVEDIYNKADVEDMLNTYHNLITCAAREGYEEFINLNAVHMAQILNMAESNGLQCDSADVSFVDQYGAAALSSMASNCSAPAAGASVKHPGALPSLGAGTPAWQRQQELEEENKQMRDRYQQMQEEVSELLRDRSMLSAQLAAAQEQVNPVQPSPLPPLEPSGGKFNSDSHQFKDLKFILQKKTDEIKLLRQHLAAHGLPVPYTHGGVEIAPDDD